MEMAWHGQFMEFLLPKNTVHSLVKIVPVVLENMNKIEEVYDDYDKDDNERQLLAKLAWSFR